MTTAPSRSRPLTRRGALRLLGGAGVGLITARCGAPERAAAPLQDERASSVTFPNGAIIRTVLSDVDPEVLGDGATLFHEHLSLSDPLPPWVPPSDNPLGAFTTDLDLMADEVNATAQEGVSCIVSGGTRDLGQSFERLRTLAGRTDMHIVVASGLWTQPRYPPDIAEKSEDQVAEDFLRDATAERWGAIGEIGSSLTMHPDEQKVLRAACQVHLRTALPLFTHTPHQGCRSCAVEQLDIIESMQVDPRLVCIGPPRRHHRRPDGRHTHSARPTRRVPRVRYGGPSDHAGRREEGDDDRVGHRRGARRPRAPVRRLRGRAGAQGERRRGVLLGCDGFRAETTVRRRTRGDDPEDPRRQPETVSRVRAEGRIAGDPRIPCRVARRRARGGGRGVYFKDPSGHILELLTAG